MGDPAPIARIAVDNIRCVRAGLTPLQQILKTSQPAVIDNQLYMKADCQ
jgi:hypothetical protein